jgi:hypothetical protein
MLLFYDILNKIGFEINNIKEKFGDINDLIFHEIKNSLKSNNYLKIKHSLEHIIKMDSIPEISGFFRNPQFKKKIEKFFYTELSKSLDLKKYKRFENLIHSSDKLDIFIDINRIQNRFAFLKRTIIECIENVSMGYQTSSLGEIIEHIKFYNKYSLLAKKFTKEDKNELISLKEDFLLLENLKDLFNTISDSLLLYIRRSLPSILYEFFIKNKTTLFYSDIEELMNYIKYQFFNSYTIYGLSVRNLGSTLKFVKDFKEQFYRNKNQIKFKLNNEIFFEFSTKYKYPIHFYGGSYEPREQTSVKKHLVSPHNVLVNLNKILSNNKYSFLNLSMVLIGGIGPQGHGFTYSTPKGEVIEICSDRKENEAIIIKFKEFLKNQFINKLEEDLLEQNIEVDMVIEIINKLDDTLQRNELINYNKKEQILKHIKKMIFCSLNQTNNEKIANKIFNKISESIDLILRPISMEDQFKTRMKLISSGKIDPEDVAKLTSLKGKSHYDVLRERFFFQYIINWFYEIYIENKG